MAILAAVTCGCAGFFISMGIHPYDKEYGYMSFRPIEKKINFNKRHISNLESKQTEVEQQIYSTETKLPNLEERLIQRKLNKLPAPDLYGGISILREQLSQLRNDLTKTKIQITKAKALQNQLQNKLSGSKAKLVGFYVLAGLVPAAIGFCVIWIIYYLIKWLILGFADEKLTAKQKQ